MPFVSLKVSVSIDEKTQQDLLGKISKIIAEGIGKSEKYVMATVESSAMIMSASPGNAAFADVRSIGGLSQEINKNLSQQICMLIHQILGIPQDRIYINFFDIERASWGWNGTTFG